MFGITHYGSLLRVVSQIKARLPTIIVNSILIVLIHVVENYADQNMGNSFINQTDKYQLCQSNRFIILDFNE